MDAAGDVDSAGIAGGASFAVVPASLAWLDALAMASSCLQSMKRSPVARKRHLPTGRSPSITRPMRTRFNASTCKPTASHMRRICRFFPSRSTKHN